MTVALILFSCSLAAVLYLLVGYPLLLRMLPKTPTPVKKCDTHTPSVTVLMAVYNGADYLAEKLTNLLALDYPKHLIELIVVSDGSTDETDLIAESFVAQGIKFFAVPRGGKAAALNAGLEHATGSVVFFCDVRQRIEKNAVRQLAANFADPTVGAVTGELKILNPEGAAGEQADMDLYWRYELWVRAQHSAIWSLFNTTGCLYAMRRELCLPLPKGTIGDDAVLPLAAYLQGFRIVFDPTAVAHDFATKEGTDWKRRMRTLSGMWQVYSIYPRLLFFPHRMWLHFFSHKLGRLLLPWAILGTLVASFFLPASPWKWLVIGVQLGVVFAASLDPLAPDSMPGKRIISLCRTFVVLNYAALLSARVLFVSPLKLWGVTKVDRVASPN